MSRIVTIHEEPLDNPHTASPDVHHRLYLTGDGTPTVVCVQGFDYPDYDAKRFLTVEAYPDEPAAHEALAHMLGAELDCDENTLRKVALLADLGAPLTRAQAVTAHVARARANAARPLPAGELTVEPDDVVLILRDDGAEGLGAEAVLLDRTLGDLPAAKTVADHDAGTALTWTRHRENAITACHVGARYVITIV